MTMWRYQSTLVARGDGTHDYDIIKDTDGDYVLYSDHLVVLAEKDKQIAALTTKRDLMKECLFPEQLKIIQSNLKAFRGEEE